jgi:predicted NBD/HSP70 family sugar kinase
MNIKLRRPPLLDPDFQPAVLVDRRYAAAAKAAGDAVPLVIGLERESDLLSCNETVVAPRADTETLRYVERTVKFLLWARGGWKIHFGGPKPLGEFIQRSYSPAGERAFDVELMGRVYERPFEVALTDAKSVPPEKELSTPLGGHLDGCRIGFDLGASDYKIAAVRDGEVVYSEEFPWNPKDEPNPDYHYSHLTAGLKKAASYLPRVDGIGGSSAGVIVGNRIMVASLFRAVPPSRFGAAKNIFLRIRREWGVPLEVANDGDVTALAGAMSLKTNAILGIAMGSSQAAGYLNTKGCMTGWLNELAFAPVDENPGAPEDEWSGDRGAGVVYFSQQAVGRLLSKAGIEVEASLSFPERLRLVQDLMDKGDGRAEKIYRTIGSYLGYAIPHYADFYKIKNVLVLGRVLSGPGGAILLRQTQDILNEEFPTLAANIRLRVPDERDKRHGQAIAAASLPYIQAG